VTRRSDLHHKLDRDGRQPIELLDEIEKVLGIAPPHHWPIGMDVSCAASITSWKIALRLRGG